jgi:hypothetical protein
MRYLRCIMLFILVLLSGCAAARQAMIHPYSKAQVTCEGFGFGLYGTPAALIAYSNCLDQYKVLGYVPIEEYDKNESGKLDTESIPSSPCNRPIIDEKSEWHFLVNGREVYFKFIGKEEFKYQTVYRFFNSNGKFYLYSESLGIVAILDQKGTVEAEFDPPVDEYDWPLSVGKTWSAQVKKETPQKNDNLYINYEVKGYGKIKVPAGEFDSYYIIARSYGGVRTAEFWYNPEVKFYIKRITYSQKGPVTTELKSYSHPAP